MKFSYFLQLFQDTNDLYFPSHHSICFQSEFSTKTISEIKDHLLTSLKKIEKLKNEKEIMADLWCHFGKVLVYCVDEGNHNNWVFTVRRKWRF